MVIGEQAMTGEEVEMISEYLIRMEDVLRDMETGRACNPEPLFKSLFADLSELYASYEMRWDDEEDAA
jgi:hypothetical protein